MQAVTSKSSFANKSARNVSVQRKCINNQTSVGRRQLLASHGGSKHLLPPLALSLSVFLAYARLRNSST